MGFWSFLRDMLVLDWLFGHHNKHPFGEQSQDEYHRYRDSSYSDDYQIRGYGGYSHNDYAQQDFDDDLDSGMFDDF